jgi:hypothetical protein
LNISFYYDKNSRKAKNGRTDEDGFTSVGHGDSVAGYNAGMVFHPESMIGVAIFRNYYRGKTNLGRPKRFTQRACKRKSFSIEAESLASVTLTDTHVSLK